MRRMRLGAALAAVLLLSGCATGVAEPSTSALLDAAPDAGREMTPDEMLSMDADASGVAIDELEAQTEFSRAVEYFDLRFPGEFTEAIWRASHGEVAFRGAAPAEVLTELSATEGIIVIEHVGWSALDELAALDALQAAASGAGALLVGGASVLPLDRVIEVHVEARPETAAAVRDAVEAVPLPGPYRLELQLLGPGETEDAVEPGGVGPQPCDETCAELWPLS